MNRRLRSWVRDRAGNSAVEFALVLPLLSLLLFGFFEAGRMFWTYNIVSASVRDAGRYAARQSMNCGGFANGAETANTQRLARTGTVDVGGAPLVQNWTNDASITVAITCIANPTGGTTYSGHYDGLTQIPRVQVTATAPFVSTFATLFPGLNLGTITVAHSEAWAE